MRLGSTFEWKQKNFISQIPHTVGTTHQKLSEKYSPNITCSQIRSKLKAFFPTHTKAVKRHYKRQADWKSYNHRNVSSIHRSWAHAPIQLKSHKQQESERKFHKIHTVSEKKKRENFQSFSAFQLHTVFRSVK